MIGQAKIKDIMWDSAKEAFETMIFMPIKRTDNNPAQQDTQSFICTITFSGQMQGAFSILCSPKVLEKITRSMLMMESDEPLSETDICDAYGEVTNLLIGGLKTRISDIVPDIKISIPSVFKGNRIRPGAGSGLERVNLDTDLDGEPVQMALVYKSLN